jgi:hypothetical protein
VNTSINCSLGWSHARSNDCLWLSSRNHEKLRSNSLIIIASNGVCLRSFGTAFWVSLQEPTPRSCCIYILYHATLLLLSVRLSVRLLMSNAIIYEYGTCSTHSHLGCSKQSALAQSLRFGRLFYQESIGFMCHASRVLRPSFVQSGALTDQTAPGWFETDLIVTAAEKKRFIHRV